MEKMAVPLDTRNDIRSTGADGVPRAEIARRLGASRNTVAKYDDQARHACLVEGIDRMDAAGRRQTLRPISRAAESSGLGAACDAALRVVEGGRVPDDATVDVPARRTAGGALPGGGRR